MTWNRSCDAHLARLEGGKPVRERGIPERLWKWEFPDGRREHLPAYNLDLVAAVRVAEKWCCQNPVGTYRGMRLEYRPWSLGGQYEWELYEEPADHPAKFYHWLAEGPQNAAALSLAIYRASGGLEVGG